MPKLHTLHLLRYSAILWGLTATAACSSGRPHTGSGSAGAESDAGADSGGKTSDHELETGGTDSDGTARGGTGGTGGKTSASTTSVAKCGDGILSSKEACDDKNVLDGDGCSADCSTVEADYVCPTPGTKCVPANVCGDRKITGTENCDDGNAIALDGCSATCRVEDGFGCAFVGVKCQPICGDGLVRGGEQCDDGGTAASPVDGCSATCTVDSPLASERDGWLCTTADGNSKSVCKRTTCGNAVVEGSEQCDDGNNDQGDGCTPFCRWEPICATDGSGCRTACGDGLLLDSDADQQCDDGNTVSGDGCSATCTKEQGYSCVDTTATPTELVLPIVLRDFKAEGTTNGHPDFQWETTSAIVSGIVQSTLDSDGKPVHVTEAMDTTQNAYDATGALTSEDYFASWYRDNADYNKTVIQTLTFAAVASGFQFSDNTFFPLDGVGWADVASNHNFYFTSEVRYWFEYRGGETLEFVGDDDVWVFVNGQLTVDLGGVHGARAGKLVLGNEADGTVGKGIVTICPNGITCTENTTPTHTLNMALGKVYEIVVFQAERRTVASNYKLTLGSFNATRSACKTDCGDGFVTADEACDLGTAGNTGAYGTCTQDCKLPAFCGDGIVDSADGEACDNGVNLATYGYNGTPACNPSCQWTDHCGDGIVNGLFGEECDDGNDVSGDDCEPNCTHRAGCGNGTVDTTTGEECDDANTISGDGCSEFCTVERDVILT
jgi:cysteine-rich repeat protein